MPSDSPPQNAVQPYGEKIVFEQSKPLQFVDFTLTFQGQTHVKVKEYPPGFVYENFTATAKDKTQKIIWSIGTGEIAPTDFAVADENYMLELKYSDVAGNLEESELVVWREKDWQQKHAELHPTVR